jgi:hypothetical protein
MLEGAPLVHRVPGRIGWELRLVVQGGLRILDKIEAQGFDSFSRRPSSARPMRPRSVAGRGCGCDNREQNDTRMLSSTSRRKQRPRAAASITPSCFFPSRGARRSPPSMPSAARSTTWSTKCRDPGVAATKLAWWRTEVAQSFAGQPSIR